MIQKVKIQGIRFGMACVAHTMLLLFPLLVFGILGWLDSCFFFFFISVLTTLPPPFRMWNYFCAPTARSAQCLLNKCNECTDMQTPKQPMGILHPYAVPVKTSCRSACAWKLQMVDKSPNKSTTKYYKVHINTYTRRTCCRHCHFASFDQKHFIWLQRRMYLSHRFWSNIFRLAKRKSRDKHTIHQWIHIHKCTQFDKTMPAVRWHSTQLDTPFSQSMIPQCSGW